VLAPAGEMDRLAAEVQRGARVSVERADGRAALERACDGRVDVAVVVEGTDGLDLRDAQGIWRARGQAPEVVVLAPAWDEAAMRAAMELGAIEYVTAD